MEKKEKGAETENGLIAKASSVHYSEKGTECSCARPGQWSRIIMRALHKDRASKQLTWCFYAQSTRR